MPDTNSSLPSGRWRRPYWSRISDRVGFQLQAHGIARGQRHRRVEGERDRHEGGHLDRHIGRRLLQKLCGQRLTERRDRAAAGRDHDDAHQHAAAAAGAHHRAGAGMPDACVALGMGGEVGRRDGVGDGAQAAAALGADRLYRRQVAAELGCQRLDDALDAGVRFGELGHRVRGDLVALRAGTDPDAGQHHVVAPCRQAEGAVEPDVAVEPALGQVDRVVLALDVGERGHPAVGVPVHRDGDVGRHAAVLVRQRVEQRFAV